MRKKVAAVGLLALSCLLSQGTAGTEQEASKGVYIIFDGSGSM